MRLFQAAVNTILSRCAMEGTAVSESCLPVWLPTLKKKKKKPRTHTRTPTYTHSLSLSLTRTHTHAHTQWERRSWGTFETWVGVCKKRKSPDLDRTASKADGRFLQLLSAPGNQWGPRCSLLQLSVPRSPIGSGTYCSAFQLFFFFLSPSVCFCVFRNTEGKEEKGKVFFLAFSQKNFISIFCSLSAFFLPFPFLPAINMRGRFVVTLLWKLICAASCALLRVG